MYWKEGDVRGASCLPSVLEMGMVEPGHMNGGADAQIVPAGPATDVMDDENDKVSQDVVGAPLSSGIHEFQWSQAGQSSALQQCANVTMSQTLVSIGARRRQWNLPSSSSTDLSLTLSLPQAIFNIDSLLLRKLCFPSFGVEDDNPSTSCFK